MTRITVRRQVTWLALGGALLLAQPATAASAHRWRTYTNVRFGYSLCYPAALLTPQTEAENGDGREFRGATGARLRVWGQHNALDLSLAEAMQQQQAHYRGERSRITYRAQGAGWFVLSGYSGNAVFYARTILANDRFASIELRYPRADASLWNGIAGRIARCLAG